MSDNGFSTLFYDGNSTIDRGIGSESTEAPSSSGTRYPSRPMDENDNSVVQTALGENSVDYGHSPVPTFSVLSASNLFVPTSDENNYIFGRDGFTRQPESSIKSNSVPDSSICKQTRGRNFIKDPLDLDASDGLVAAKPMYKRYSTLHARLLTYLNKWSNLKKQRPEELSRAGFFHVGREDGVKCFFCNIGLKNWRNDDIPWLEHARWAPKCGYLRQNRGLVFITTVQRLQKNKQADLNNREIRRLLRDVLPEEEKKECTATLSPAVESLLWMGYSISEIKRAKSVIRHRSCTKGPLELSAKEILETIMENEGKDQERFAEEDCDEPDAGENLTDGSEARRTANSAFICTICMENSVTILFVPCCHLVTCAECAFAFDNCPICRKLITGTLRVQREYDEMDFTAT